MISLFVLTMGIVLRVNLLKSKWLNDSSRIDTPVIMMHSIEINVSKNMKSVVTWNTESSFQWQLKRRQNNRWVKLLSQEVLSWAHYLLFSALPRPKALGRQSTSFSSIYWFPWLERIFTRMCWRFWRDLNLQLSLCHSSSSTGFQDLEPSSVFSRTQRMMNTLNR